MVKNITETEKILEAEKAFFKIFKSNNPENQPFQSTIKEKCIISPVDYELCPDLFNSIADSALTINERKGCITITEGLSNFNYREAHHWIVDMEEYPYEILLKDEQWLAVAENAIYSLNGSWGIIISNDQFAIIGGSIEFMNNFRVKYRNLQNSIKEFFRYWKLEQKTFNVDVSWIPSLIHHVYGKEKSSKIIKEYGKGIEFK